MNLTNQKFLSTKSALFAVVSLASPALAQTAQTTPVNRPAVGGSATPAAPPTNVPFLAGPEQVAEDYRLDTEDSISVDILRHPDVSRTLRIPPDGMVRMPRVSSAIRARGLTVAELAQDISQKLQSEGKLRLRPGMVSVSVVTPRPRLVYLTGSAGKNTYLPLQNGWRVREIVSATGGIANPERVRAEINNPKRPGSVKFDLQRALSEPESADNVLLMEGDTVALHLPEAKRLFVKGEGPRGEHGLDERFGLRQALIKLGMAANNTSGDLRRARLLRHETPGDPNSPQTVIPVDLYTLLTDDTAPDVALQDMDTLDIPLSQNFVYIFGKIGAPRRWQLPEDRPTRLVDLMTLGETFGNARIGSVTVMRREPLVNGKLPKGDKGKILEAPRTEAKPTPEVDPRTGTRPSVVAGVNDVTGETGVLVSREYDFGRFLSKGDVSQNPLIRPGDLVMVPEVRRTDVPGTIWTGWGFFNILQTLVPGLRLR
jgi:protein involved in polysaccharide export with SLBB domain